MALSPAEAAVQKRVTRKFIEADETSVILNRAGLTPNGAGGFLRGEADTLEPLVCRLIPQSGRYGEPETHEMLDGQTVTVNFHLLAEVGSDVQVGDWFFREDRKHEVLWVLEPGGYELKAGVTDRG